MAYTNRGGPPFVRRITATTAGVIAADGVGSSDQAAGAPYVLPSPTSHLRLVATGSPAQVYFSQADFDAAGPHYLTVGTSLPVECAAEVSRLWVKGSGGTTTLEILGISKV